MLFKNFFRDNIFHGKKAGKLYSFQTIPYEGVFHMLYQKIVKTDNFLTHFHTWWLYSRNNENLKTLQLLLLAENARNKQTIKGKD